MRMSTPLRTLLLLATLGFASCTGSTNPAPQGAVAPVPTNAPTPASQERASAPTPSAKPESSNMNPSQPASSEVATFGAGCFWCIEAVLLRIDGVQSVESGYMGGALDNPTYEDVCTGTTGHAEVVRVAFDPSKLSYGALCDWFFQAHDPTTLNKQGNDHGTQYRSAIFYTSEAQRTEATAAKDRAKAHWSDPIVTEIKIGRAHV